jgi:phospholipid/cholesterol/gamma-HCH transport system permease protein
MTAVLAYIGRNTFAAYRYFVGLYEMTAKAVYWTFVAPFEGRKLKWGYALHQMVLVGYSAVPIVFLISFFVGLILALQGAHELVKLGGATYTMSLVAVAMTREIGPLMTAIVVAGRSGSAFAAEIGTMKVTEELDAYEAMGLSSVRFLVVPKYLSMLLMMPCLTMLSDLAGILGGLLFSVLQLGQSLALVWNSTIDSLSMQDIWTGLIKSLVFGAVITEVGCFEGFSVRGGAEGVGKSTTASVVNSIIMVIAADVVFTTLFYYTGG